MPTAILRLNINYCGTLLKGHDQGNSLVDDQVGGDGQGY